MAPREALVDLIERIPDDDLPVVRSVLAHFVPGLSAAELKAIADAGTPDPEPLSDGERIGFAEAEAYLAGEGEVLSHEEVMGRLRKSARR